MGKNIDLYKRMPINHHTPVQTPSSDRRCTEKKGFFQESEYDIFPALLPLRVLQ